MNFKKKLKEAPLYYWEEKSYMMVIPKNEEEDILSNAMDRLSSMKDVELLETNYK